jgi:nitrate/nitrite-specific signal transduction histidine kinase
MKKVITLIFTALIVFIFSTAVFAENGEGVVDKTDTEETYEQINEETSKETTADDVAIYIQEKIVPVVIGVVTAVIALLGSINSIKKTLISLKGSKDVLELAQSTFDTELGNIKGTLKNELENIKNEIQGMPELKEKFDSLKGDVDDVTTQLKTIADILALAYSSNEDLVRSGKASKMYKLLESVKASEANENEGEN